MEEKNADDVKIPKVEFNILDDNPDSQPEQEQETEQDTYANSDGITTKQDTEPAPKIQRTKKQRSAKQIEAFEKAKLKRAENLKMKKIIQEELKVKKKQEKEQIKAEVKKRISDKKKYVKPAPDNFVDSSDESEEEIIYKKKPKKTKSKKKKKKVVYLSESSSEEESTSEDDEDYTPPPVSKKSKLVRQKTSIYPLKYSDLIKYV